MVCALPDQKKVEFFDGTTHSISASQCWIWQADDTLLIERRNFPQILPAAPPEPPSNLDCQKSVHRTHLAVLHCWILQFFSQSPSLKINFFSAFSPLVRGKRTPFLNCASADLHSATDALAKKTPPCPGKTTPFPGRGLFWHRARWQKNTFGDARAFPANNRAGKKAPSETRILFPGDPKSWQKKIHRWQKNTQSLSEMDKRSLDSLI